MRSGYSSVIEKKEPTLASMQTGLIGHIAEFGNQLRISRTKRSKAGQSVKAVSCHAARSGSQAQAGGRGLTTLPGSAVSGNVGDILDRNKNVRNSLTDL